MDPAPVKPPDLTDETPRPPRGIDYAPARRPAIDRLLDYLPSPEQLSNFFKTLIWVAPLTILIWVYAEREETVKVTLPAFPIGVKTTAPDRVVALRYPADHNVVVELSGPRAKIDRVRELLLPKPDGAAIQLFVDPQLGLGGKELLAVSQLNNHPLFRNNGITVRSCQPQSFSVDIDQIEEREAIVKPSPESSKAVEYANFHPDRVKIRAPSQLFDRAPKDDETKELIVYADFARRSELRTKTGKVELDNVLINWIQREQVALSHQTVHATLNLKQADVSYILPQAVGITKETPANFEDKYKAEYSTTIPVTVIGPPDQIEVIKKDPGKVKARLEIRAFDKVGVTERRPLIFDLPPGVRLTEETLQRAAAWEFRLVER